MIKLDQMVLKGVNLGKQYKYRGYLLRQVVFHFTEKSMDLSVWCCPFEGWVGNVVFAVSEIKSAWKLQFSSKSMVFIKICCFHQNLWFSSKSAVFVKICGFQQNPQFSSKSMIFIKICNFCHFSLSFQEDNIKCETKEHLPRKVIPTFFTLCTQLTPSKTIWPGFGSFGFAIMSLYNHDSRSGS